MRKKFRIKSNLLAALTFIVFLLSVFKVWVAFSMSNLFVLEDVSVLTKSDTVEEGVLSFAENKITSDSVKFHKVGDHITYSVKIKNDKNENYILKSINDDNKNEYLSYSYNDYKDAKINSGESFDFVFTEKYSQEVEDIQKREQNFPVNFYFTLEIQKENEKQENNENTQKEGKIVFDKKAVTGDNMEFYVVLAIISLILSLFIFRKAGIKKIKKSSLGLFILFTALYVAFIPQMAKGVEGQAFKMALENSIELKDKLVVAYDVDGITNTKIVPYNTKVSIDEPYKEGYTFKGWRTDDGALFDLDTPIEDDINLTAAFEADTYSITYDLHGGQAENPTSYTVEDEVQINDPTREGYTFDGWTGTDLSEPTKNLVIPQNSMGDRAYEAHWTANEYTVLFDANTGEGNMNQATFTYDVAGYLPPNTFTKTDNKFICWNTEANGSGISYTNESYVKNLTSGNKVTLYAQWASSSDCAMFIKGQDLNRAMKEIAKGDEVSYEYMDYIITSIERSSSPGPSGAREVSISGSPPIYMWYSSGTIYYYSPATYIYLNADSKNVFGSFGALTNIDYNGFLTDEVTDMHSMFASSTSLTEINLANFNTAKVTDMGSMFNQCTGATVIDVSKFDTRRVTTMNRMFTACEKVKDLDLSRFNTSSVTNMEKTFDYLPLVESIEVDHFDTSHVTTMVGMFRDCPKLTTLDLSSFDTRNVTNMSEMFGCTDRVESSGLTSITINSSKFNTAKVTTMKQMFYKCSKLQSFDFSGFNTANVTNMQSMFAQCHSLTSLDLSSFSTSKVTTMQSMFNNCNSLVSIDVSTFDTHLVTTMNRMFSSCSSLVTLDVSSFNTQSVTDMTKMFDNMSSLTTIYASDNFTTASVIYGSDVFKNDKRLVGGSGTACNGQQRLGYTYARIDGGEPSPGYFTEKI